MAKVGVLPRGPHTAFTGFAAFPPPARENRLWVRVSMTKGALLAPGKNQLTSPYIRRIFTPNSLRAVGYQTYCRGPASGVIFPVFHCTSRNASSSITAHCGGLLGDILYVKR